MNKPSAPARLASLSRSLCRRPVTDLPLVFAPVFELPEEDPDDQALYTRTRTFWLFLLQVLSPGMPCQEIVHKALAWFQAQYHQKASSNTSGYCQARKRLDLLWLQDQCRQLAIKLEADARPVWCGRRVVVPDGSSLSMPDTFPNQRRWPQPKGQKPGCGFPVMRLVCVFCLATGALLHFATGPLEMGEASLWRMLWGQLRRGDVILGDRNFSSFAEFYLLSKRGMDLVARRKANRTTGARRVKRLGKGDWLVEWTRDKHCPLWLAWCYKPFVPKTLLVREVEFSVAIPGFRTTRVVVATTLLDSKAYPAEAFPNLYRRRWEAELRLRDLKTTMKMEVLRSKTPEMVEREVAMHWIAYNLLRSLMAQSAREYGQDPVRLSFKSCLGLVRQWSGELGRAQTSEEVERLRDEMRRSLAEQVIRAKPNRHEPRALKRRPKTYARLTKPRSQFQDIPHRNRYKKAKLTPSATAA